MNVVNRVTSRILTATTIERISIAINEMFRASTPSNAKQIDAYEAWHLATKSISTRYWR
jgi:hypothetical protein